MLLEKWIFTINSWIFDGIIDVHIIDVVENIGSWSLTNIRETLQFLNKFKKSREIFGSWKFKCDFIDVLIHSAPARANACR